MSFKFKQGEHVKDTITGFMGHIVARSDHLTGCNRYAIQPKGNDPSKLDDAFWLDEQRLQPTGRRSITIPTQPGEPEAKPGAATTDPSLHHRTP